MTGDTNDKSGAVNGTAEHRLGPDGTVIEPAVPGIAASRGGTERTDPRTLEMLVCPLSKAPLEYDATRQELRSRRANVAYPIRSGVPLLTRDTARSLDT